MSSKRGQAAMEFLMTYGWAILVVLAAIGALAYFGILSPSKFLPSSCVISGGFSCVEYKVTNSTVTMGIQNNLGVTADAVNVSLSSADCTITPPNVPYSSVENGAKLGTTLTQFNCTLTDKSKFKGDITITYVKSGESLSHTASGTIQSAVE